MTKTERPDDTGASTFFTVLAGHSEGHKTGRAGWLRAAVLGANDGLVSTSSLMVGVVAAGASTGAVLTAGIAGLSAGAMAMAAGEYVSVSAQSDVESADRQTEMADEKFRRRHDVDEESGKKTGHRKTGRQEKRRGHDAPIATQQVGRME